MKTSPCCAVAGFKKELVDVEDRYGAYPRKRKELLEMKGPRRRKALVAVDRSAIASIPSGRGSYGLSQWLIEINAALWQRSLALIMISCTQSSSRSKKLPLERRMASLSRYLSLRRRLCKPRIGRKLASPNPSSARSLKSIRIIADLTSSDCARKKNGKAGAA